MRPSVIDIHPHVISTDTARYPRAPLGGHQSDWSAERPVSYEQLLADMAEAGVDKAAIVQASTCYGHDNSYVIDAVAARPDKFTAVGSVDILADDAVQKIKDEVAGEIEVAGPTLAASLSALGLIDRYRLYVHPVVLGSGTRFFAGTPPALRLEASEDMGEDVVRLTYIPA